MKFADYAVDDVITLVRRPVLPEPDREYREIGIRSFGNGIFHKEPVSGDKIAAKKVFSIESGDLVFSNVFAWEGAVARASAAENGMIGSHPFMTYRVNEEVADPRYLLPYFYGGPGLDVIRRASPGSAGRNRTLGIKTFGAKRIVLPDVAEQRRVADKLDKLMAKHGRARDAIPSQPAVRQLAVAGLDRVLNRWADETLRVDQVCALVNDTVHPGDDLGQASEFVGLEHIAPHFGQRIGSRPLGDEKGRKFRFAPGDILYGYLRPYLNKVWLADRHGLCSVEQYVLRPNGTVPAELIAAGLRSKATLDKVLDATHNLQLPRLRSGLLMAMEIPAVPRKHHKQAMAEVEELNQCVISLAERQRHREDLMAALRPALLDAAFSGRL